MSVPEIIQAIQQLHGCIRSPSATSLPVVKEALRALSKDSTAAALADRITDIDSLPKESDAIQKIMNRIIRTLDDEAIAKLLELNTWETTGNREEACKKIIACFRERNVSLSLSSLGLSSLPEKAFSYLSFLYILDCSDNQLTTLSLSNFLALKSLHCSGNQLTTLSLFNLPALKDLYCSNNQLTTLSLSNLLALRTLICSDNQLTTLSLFNLLALKDLYCSNNQLTTLSLSNLPALEYLHCSNNQLTTFSLSNLLALRTLICSGNRPLRGIPESLFRLGSHCVVDLSDCSISSQEQRDIERRMGMHGYSGPTFYFGEGDSQQRADSLMDLIQLLKETTPNSALKELVIQRLEGVSEELLQNWLKRVVQAKDFTTAQTKALFATRVLRILQYAIINPEYRALLIPILEEATGTCSDRAVLGLNTLELQRCLFLASGRSLTDALHLVRGAYIMDILEKIARETVPTLRERGASVDEIEVYLGLQVHLRKEFSLPIETEGMNFYGCSSLTEEDIQNARKKIESHLAQQDTFVAFCLSQEFWKKKLEQEYPKELGATLAPLHQQLEKIEAASQSGQYLEEMQQAKAQYEEARSKFFEDKTRELLNAEAGPAPAG